MPLDGDILCEQVAAQMPDQSDNDLVFQEAADMLWSPLVGPSPTPLRSG